MFLFLIFSSGNPVRLDKPMVLEERGLKLICFFAIRLSVWGWLVSYFAIRYPQNARKFIAFNIRHILGGYTVREATFDPYGTDSWKDGQTYVL